jgi:hypothetical protein
LWFVFNNFKLRFERHYASYDIMLLKMTTNYWHVTSHLPLPNSCNGAVSNVRYSTLNDRMLVNQSIENNVAVEGRGLI